LRLSLEHARQLGFTPHPDAVEVHVIGVTKFEQAQRSSGDNTNGK